MTRQLKNSQHHFFAMRECRVTAKFDDHEHAQVNIHSGWKPDDTASWEICRYGEAALRPHPEIYRLPFVGPAS